MQGEAEIVGGLIVSCIIWPWMAVLIFASVWEGPLPIAKRKTLAVGESRKQGSDIYTLYKIEYGIRYWKIRKNP